MKNRTRQGPIRTFSLIPIKIKITFNKVVPLYQKLRSKINELKALDMTNVEIAKQLKIRTKTARNGLINF